MATELSVAVSVIFSGDTKTRDAYTPEAFLKEVEAKRVRNGLTDAQTMQYMKSCLRGEAFQWLHYGTQLGKKDQDNQNLVLTDYTTFRKEFMRHYHLSGITRRVPWKGTLEQRHGETARAYMGRAMEEIVRSLDDKLIKWKTRCVPETVINLDAPLTLAAVAGPVAVDALTNAQRAALDIQVTDYIRTLVAATIEKTIVNTTFAVKDLFGREIIVDGLKNPTVRQRAHEWDDRGIPTQEMADRIQQYEMQVTKNTSHAGAYEVDADGNDIEIGAVSNKGRSSSSRGRGRGRGRGGRGSNSSSRDNNKSCTFCLRTGHSVEDCRDKEKHNSRMHRQQASKISEQPQQQQVTAIHAGNSQPW